MIAAHCGAGGYAITREGEALVGDTVVTEGAASVDAQTTEGGGQVQGHDSSKTVYARGSDWQVHYNCNNPGTVNMGLITRSRTEASKLAWGVDVAGGMMILAGKAESLGVGYQAPRAGAGTGLGATAWLGWKLSEKFALGAGLGTMQVIAMPQWEQGFDNGSQMSYEYEATNDASSFELFATAKYGMSPKLDLQVRVGVADWGGVNVDGATPLAALQLGYRVIDVGADSGVYLGGGVSTYFSSSLTNNVSPAVTVGFH
jgi:hypothetical protein